MLEDLNEIFCGGFDVFKVKFMGYRRDLARDFVLAFLRKYFY